VHGGSYHADNPFAVEPRLKFLKIAAAFVLVLLALAAGAVALAVVLGERKMEREVDVRVVPVPFTKDPAAVKLGKYLYETRGCGECHGADGAGRVMLDEPGGMRVKSPNLTAGPGGIAGTYTEADWVRAVRHGVNPKGHSLMVMPSQDYSRLNDADFAALIAYVRSLPAASGTGAEIRLPLLVRALYGVGLIQDSSERIDHRKPPSAPIAVAPTVGHGAYVAAMCVGCHGAAFSGGRIPGTPPDWPPAANLTPGEGGLLARYADAAQFAAMMRSGKRPDGSEVSKVMPFAALAAMTDVDLEAMYAYLKTLPAKKTGER
jgi:mono/diheme cytochrome c family protein